MKLVILPLTVSGSSGKQVMLEKVMSLTSEIADEKQRIFIISGAVVASDKFIDREYLKQVRRMVDMTKLSQLYEEEKIEYGNQRAKEAAREAAREAEKETTLKMALKLFNHNMDIAEIMDITGMTEAELLRLREENVTA